MNLAIYRQIHKSCPCTWRRNPGVVLDRRMFAIAIFARAVAPTMVPSLATTPWAVLVLVVLSLTTISSGTPPQCATGRTLSICHPKKSDHFFPLIDHPACPISHGRSNQRKPPAYPYSSSPHTSLGALLLLVGCVGEARCRSLCNRRLCKSGVIEGYRRHGVIYHAPINIKVG